MRGLMIVCALVVGCGGGGGADPGPDAEPLCEGCTVYICGDGMIEGPEECDGDDLGAVTDCVDVGFYDAGAVTCSDECTLDVSACTGFCGDGVLNGYEECDDDVAEATCLDFGFYDEPGVACTPACTGFCGDGVVDPAEQCDGDDLDGAGCTDLGFDEADGLACTSACTYDVSACEGFCGDGVVSGFEQCEGTDLGGLDCTTLGFYEPDGLACGPNCAFDTAACEGYCGDGVLNGYEECDDDVAEATCLDFGFYDEPGVACTPACAFDTTACTGFCGDKALNGDESCEGAAPPVWSCTMFGYGGGDLGCTAGCHPSFERCRVGPCAGTEVTCGDSIDDDCDGDLDCADTDCATDGFCTGGGWCGGAIALACDSSVIGTTSGENGYIDAYSCAAFEEQGREVFYEVVPTSSGSVTVTLIAGSDLDLIVLDDTCDPEGGCVDASTISFEVDTVTFSAQAGTTYYLVVDGYANNAGGFNLAVDCP